MFIGAAEELYARIPRANLPKCFGGDLENVVHPILPSQYYPLHFPKLRDLPVEALKTTVLPGTAVAHVRTRGHPAPAC